MWPLWTSSQPDQPSWVKDRGRKEEERREGRGEMERERREKRRGGGRGKKEGKREERKVTGRREDRERIEKKESTGRRWGEGGHGIIKLKFYNYILVILNSL